MIKMTNLRDRRGNPILRIGKYDKIKSEKVVFPFNIVQTETLDFVFSLKGFSMISRTYDRFGYIKSTTKKILLNKEDILEESDLLNTLNERLTTALKLSKLKYTEDYEVYIKRFLEDIERDIDNDLIFFVQKGINKIFRRKRKWKKEKENLVSD